MIGYLKRRNYRMKIDSADILIILCGIALVTVPVCIGIKIINDGKDNEEKDCVDFYKENHYILKSCENYRDKLLKLELIEDNE